MPRDTSIAAVDARQAFVSLESSEVVVGGSSINSSSSSSSTSSSTSSTSVSVCDDGGADCTGTGIYEMKPTSANLNATFVDDGDIEINNLLSLHSIFDNNDDLEGSASSAFLNLESAAAVSETRARDLDARILRSNALLYRSCCVLSPEQVVAVLSATSKGRFRDEVLPPDGQQWYRICYRVNVDCFFNSTFFYM